MLKGNGEGPQAHTGLCAYEVTFTGVGHELLVHIETERCTGAALHLKRGAIP